MEKTIFELKTSVERYYADQVSFIPSQGYGAKFSIIETNSYNWNRFDALFYKNRQDGDIEMNGWTFSNMISGDYRIYNQMPSDSPEFTIKAIDPQQHRWELKVHTEGFFKEAAADYLNNIDFISKFPNRECAKAYYYVKNKEDSYESTEFLGYLKKLRDYYQSCYQEGENELFWDEIKTTYNKAIEDYKESIDSLKL